jgi:hypothetical protein
MNNTFFESNSYEFPVAVITGVCRSGKSLLGNILATCQEVEYAEEPWAAMSFPLAISKGNMNKEFSATWLNSYIVELFSELILLRSANFRHQDLSSIWTKKHLRRYFIEWQQSILTRKQCVILNHIAQL